MQHCSGLSAPSQLKPQVPAEVQAVIGDVLEADLKEVADNVAPHCLGHQTARKDAAALDFRVHLQSRLLPHLSFLAPALGAINGERQGSGAVGALTRKACA